MQDYISKSIKSIINNTYKNFELVIVNDGSIDKTEEIIKSFNDDRIKYIKKSNSGLIETLNYGIQKCNYSIIMRMDGDDIILSNKIENQLNYFRKSNSILTGTFGYLIDSHGNKRAPIDLPTKHNEILKSMLKMSPSFIHPSVMFYKDAVLEVGGYDLNFKHAEDFDLFLRLSKIGKISNLAERLIYLRKHENNISLLNAEEQIRNTIISKDIYKHNIFKANKSTYTKFKQKIEKSFFNRIYTKVHLLIVKVENENLKKDFFILLFLKVFRRVLKILV
jgi:glycosyltransferase involved in cell wall biosynthesis